jgi:hypothetical protein
MRRNIWNTQETNALNFEACEWPKNIETNLIPLKKFVQELLHRSRFQLAAHYKPQSVTLKQYDIKSKLHKTMNKVVAAFAVIKSTMTVGLSSTRLLSTVAAIAIQRNGPTTLSAAPMPKTKAKAIY